MLCPVCNSCGGALEAGAVIVFRRSGLIGFSCRVELVEAVDPKDETVLAMFGNQDCFEQWMTQYRNRRMLVHWRN